MKAFCNPPSATVAAGSIIAPISVIMTLTWLTALLNLKLAVELTVANAVSTAPAEECISARASFILTAFGPVIWSTAFIASTLPKRSLNDRPDASVSVRRASKIPAALLPPAMSSWKLFPVISRIALSSRVPPLLASTNAERSVVVATDVGTPCAVIVARAAVTSSIEIPSVAAVGITLKRDAESCAKSVLPRRTPVNMMSAAFWASITPSP